MNENRDLPVHLLRYLADSELEVVSLSKDLLRILVVKEIGAERGVLEFREPSFVCIRPRVGIEAIRIGSVADLPNGFLDLMRPGDQQLEPLETVYLIDGSWGERFFVIATAITYNITS